LAGLYLFFRFSFRTCNAPPFKIDLSMRNLVRAFCGRTPLPRGFYDARSRDVAVHRHFLRRGVSLRQSLPEVEVAMDLVTLIAIICSLLLLAYLTISLLYPEKF
jgi:hypothetical protein